MIKDASIFANKGLNVAVTTLFFEGEEVSGHAEFHKNF